MLVRILSLLLAVTALHAADGSGEGKKDAPEHASLKAYSNAVIVAKEKDGGRVVEVDPNGRDLVCKREEKVIWRSGVVMANEVGAPVIRHVSIADGKVTAVVGKHRAVTLDLNTGKILGDASD